MSNIINKDYNIKNDYIAACENFNKKAKSGDNNKNIEYNAGKLLDYLDSYLSRKKPSKEDGISKEDKRDMKKAFEKNVSQYLSLEDKLYYKDKTFGKPDKKYYWSEKRHNGSTNSTFTVEAFKNESNDDIFKGGDKQNGSEAKKTKSYIDKMLQLSQKYGGRSI